MLFNGQNAAALLKTLKEVYDEHIVIKTRFEALRDVTEKALAEYKRLNERLIEKLEDQEKDRAKSEAEMFAKISMLQARLDAFSEKAMRYAVTDRVEEYLRGGTLLIARDDSGNVK
jgi:predicted translin family RNA/ssDNA-binding protein